MMTAKEIRDSYKRFFESKGHLIVPSAPMVVKDDPTLMFTNAGMNQFKDIILGNRAPKSRRVADSQKCLRVSGKHNDMEEVGHDTYHHTMFEMLGHAADDCQRHILSDDYVLRAPLPLRHASGAERRITHP